MTHTERTNAPKRRRRRPRRSHSAPRTTIFVDANDTRHRRPLFTGTEAVLRPGQRGGCR